MIKKRWLFKGLIGISIVGLVMVLASCQTKSTSSSSSSSSTNKNTASKKVLTDTQIIKNLGSKLVTTRQDDQESLNAKYLKELADQENTLAIPYVKVNPYKTSPLSALVLFTTTKAAKITYTVVGKTKNTSITNTVEDTYQTQHQVAVVGLYSGANTVKITATYEDGTSESTKLAVKTTTNLPKYVKTTKISVSKSSKAEMDIGDNKLTFLVRTTKESFAVDADGAIRWYSTLYVQHMLQPISNGHILFLTKNNQSDEVYNDLLETDYLGRVYKEYNFGTETSSSEAGEANETVIHHDIYELPNHDLIATVSDGSKYVEDTMVVISHTTGKVTKVIDLKKLLPESMYKNYKATSSGNIDWFHQNSVYYDANDGTIIISGRNQDMIMKIKLDTQEIVWIYSGKKKSSWPTKYQDKILTPTAKTTITGGQHGLSLVSAINGDASSEDVLLYDNNINLTNGDQDTSGKYSQAVQYHIDTKTMTIDQTWSYGKSLGKTNFTPAIGYAQLMTNGNYLINFGMKSNGSQSNIIEVDDQKQVFNLTVSNPSSKGYVYRAYRLPTYSDSYTFDLNSDD